MGAGFLIAFVSLGLVVGSHVHARPSFSPAALRYEAQAPATLDFGRDVQPIFKQYCVECHGPSQQMRGLRLDRRRDAMPNRVGANGARIVPGNSSASLVYRRLTGDTGAQMPPQGPLPQAHINIIKAWIDQGAEWPDALSGDTVTLQVNPAVNKMMPPDVVVSFRDSWPVPCA